MYPYLGVESVTYGSERDVAYLAVHATPTFTFAGDSEGNLLRFDTALTLQNKLPLPCRTVKGHIHLTDLVPGKHDTVWLGSNGCLVDDCGLFSSVEEFEPYNQFEARVYPNPASAYFTLKFASKYNLPVKPKIIFYNSAGQVMEEVELMSNSGQKNISVVGYPSGTYIYQIVSHTHVLSTGKVVVE